MHYPIYKGGGGHYIYHCKWDVGSGGSQDIGQHSIVFVFPLEPENISSLIIRTELELAKLKKWKIIFAYIKYKGDRVECAKCKIKNRKEDNTLSSVGIVLYRK